MIILYNTFKDIFNKSVGVGENFYTKLLETIINNPTRYVGLFRMSNIHTKLIQNVTQSREIKFGNFMEQLFTHYLEILGYTNLDKKIGKDENGLSLEVDQLFICNNTVYLIEQKMRDDHDSTKKRGQFSNFIKKMELLEKLHLDKDIIGIMWFVDDSLRKNKKYYCEESNKYNINYNKKTYICYGENLFNDILKNPYAWEEIIQYLHILRQENINNNINIPNFDTDPIILNALKNISPTYLRKLKSDTPIYNLLRQELFPTGYNLNKV